MSIKTSLKNFHFYLFFLSGEGVSRGKNPGIKLRFMVNKHVWNDLIIETKISVADLQPGRLMRFIITLILSFYLALLYQTVDLRFGTVLYSPRATELQT